MKTVIFVLMVIVSGDGVEREWKSFSRKEECLEIARAITYHREDKIRARCERREKELLYEVD